MLYAWRRAGWDRHPGEDGGYGEVLRDRRGCARLLGGGVEALLRDGVLYAEPAMSALRSGNEA